MRWENLETAKSESMEIGKQWFLTRCDCLKEEWLSQGNLIDATLFP